ncbi:MAG: glutamate--tRNA ligase [Rhodospirillaceae bacterium]|nr:glutamate--tRNA ligase [Rhodospirillaceae bacterium]MBL6930416.1 glutamate--tRNA ligase [Rhodospirillales bacterium]MBL6942468.1 glutamate--tRNA ligase [Rhodospirillales bacterium]
MTVITRFAPSPTGFLHIGGARTALFNWLFARHHGGKFLLRVEDTDRNRSTEEAVQAIYAGIKWMELDWDGEAISQYSRIDEHRKAIDQLLESGKAYKCYCSPDELTEMRELARSEGRPMRYDGRWRDKSPEDAPEGVDPVIRLKAPREGESIINDLVQGQVKVANDQLDDMVLLRADGTPTYMLAVVVDDHDMGVTHVIRGDDHLTNAFRQYQLYLALGWDVPEFAHIPLIHGADGAKLSKRHGALGVETYRDDGFLPEAMRNYLLRLGWAHGDEEFIPTDKAIEWFDLKGVGKSPSRFDVAKLTSLNAQYMREAAPSRLVNLIAPALAERLGRDVSESEKELLTKAMNGLKERAKTLVELSESAFFYIAPRPLQMNDKAQKLLADDGLEKIASLRTSLAALDGWNQQAMEDTVKQLAEAQDIKLGKLAQPLRAALSGSNVSPGIFEVMDVLGREETLGRLDDVL